MPEPQGGREGLGGWLRDKLGAQPAPGRAPVDEVAALAADVARLGWGPAPDEPAPTGAAAAAEASEQRLAFIVAYAKDPRGNPAFADLALVFKIVSKEHAYQGQEARRLAEAIAHGPQPAPTQALAQAEALHGRLFRMMRRLAGQADAPAAPSAPRPAAPAPDADAPLDMVIDHLGELLRGRGA